MDLDGDLDLQNLNLLNDVVDLVVNQFDVYNQFCVMFSHDNDLSSQQDSVGVGDFLASDDGDQSCDVSGNCDGSSDEDGNNSLQSSDDSDVSVDGDLWDHLDL